ncbi:hypothetical protein N9O24_01090, partial [bacterium]|nr:hypothetical protein [bacterium]
LDGLRVCPSLESFNGGATAKACDITNFKRIVKPLCCHFFRESRERVYQLRMAPPAKSCFTEGREMLPLARVFRLKPLGQEAFVVIQTAVNHTPSGRRG